MYKAIHKLSKKEVKAWINQEGINWFTIEFDGGQSINVHASELDFIGDDLPQLVEEEGAANWVIKPEGEANFYMVFDGSGNWLMRIQHNGELGVSEQKRNIKTLLNNLVVK